MTSMINYCTNIPVVGKLFQLQLPYYTTSEFIWTCASLNDHHIPPPLLLLLHGSTVLEELWPPHISLCEVSSQETFYGVELLTPRSTPQPGEPVGHLVWLLPFDMSAMGDPARSLLSRQHRSTSHQSSQACPTAACASTRWWFLGREHHIKLFKIKALDPSEKYIIY
jgi:hypothetical protein